MSARQSVSSLASGDVAAMAARDSVHHEHKHYDKHQSGYNGYGGYGIGWFLMVWIVLTVVIWLILVALNPVWLRGGKGKGGHGKYDSSGSYDKKKCKQADYGRAFLCALVISFILIVILWAVYAATRGTGDGHGYHHKSC